MKLRILQPNAFQFLGGLQQKIILVFTLFFFLLNYSYTQNEESIYLEPILNESANIAESSLEESCFKIIEITMENQTLGGEVDSLGCYPGDQLLVCFTINYWTAGSRCLQAIVPDFGDCLNVYPTFEGEPSDIMIPLESVTDNGEWDWWGDGVVLYNDLPDGYYPPYTPVGAGWFYTGWGSPNCPDPSDPNQSYGDCATQAWEVCFYAEPTACIEPGQELCEISLKTFSSGETGCEPFLSCPNDLPTVYQFTKKCCEEPIILNEETAFEICSGDLFELDLISNMDPETTYDWYVDTNPYGATSGTGTTISQVLTNYTDNPVTVTYFVTPTCAFGCVGLTRTFIVTIYPAVLVDLIPSADQICEGECVEITVEVNSNVFYESCVWGNNLGNSTSVFDCPQFSTYYSVTVTDVNGCTGVGETVVEVVPPVYASIAASAIEACENGPDFPITLNAIGFGAYGDFGYEWNTGETSPEISVTESGNYSVIIYDLWGGCNPGYADISIAVFPAPDVSILGPAEVCLNDGLICYTEEPPGGTWGGAASNGCIDPEILGPGSHILTYQYTDQNGCEGLVEFEVLVLGFAAVPQQLSDAVICEDASNQTYTIADVPFATGYEWIVSGTGSIVSGQGTNSIEVSWAGNPGGEVCVFSNSECGQSDPSCFEITINSIPLPVFEYADEVCLGEIVVFSYPNYPPGALCIWDFGGGSVTNGAPLDGPGPFEVVYGISGGFPVSMQVSIGGCLSDPFGGPMSVSDTLENPEITCVSTTDQVTFSWNYVYGAFEYIVNGQTQTGTSITFNNLAPGETVNVSVEAVSDGICGNSYAQAVCTVEDCPAINIQLDPVAALCQEATGTVTLQTNEPGGIWSGPGIVDATNGVFDPAAADLGTNIITYTLENGACSYSNSLEVEVTEPLLVPEINCSSSTDAVTFSWAPVPNAVTYIINGISQNGTSYEVNNLLPGELTNITIETVGVGACGSVFAQATCSAQDCPIVDIQISEINALCQEPANTVTIQTSEPGGIWSGPGIVDATNGVFDPVVADPGTNIITYTLENGACSYSNTIEVEVTEPLAVPEINCSSSIDAVTFSWAPVPNAVTYIVNGISQNGTTYIASNLLPGELVNITIEAIGTGACGSVFAQATCSAQDCPDVVLAIAPIGTICQEGNSILTLQATPPGGTWSSSCVVDENIGIFDISMAAIGENTVTYMIDDGSCSYATSIDIEVEAPLEVPEIICSNSIDGVTFSWSPVAGASSYIVNGVQQSGTNFQVTNLQPGEFVNIEVEAFGNGVCGSSFAQSTCAAQECPPVSINIQAVQDLCLNALPADVIILEALVQGGFGNEAGVWSGPGIVNTMNGLFDPNASSVTEGANEITFNYNEGSCTHSESIFINVFAPPSVQAGESLMLTCNAPELSLSGNGDGNPIWSGPGIISGENTFTPVINAPGAYTLTIINPITGCFATDVVEVFENTNTPTAEVGEDLLLTCVDLEVQLSSVGNTANYLIPQWEGPGINSSNINVQNPVVDVPGVYTLTILDTENGCESPPVSMTVEQNTISPLTNVETTGNLDCSGSMVILEAEVQSNVEYEWTGPDGSVFNEASIETILEGVYTLVVIDVNNGCTATDEVLIENNAVAPNADAGDDKELNCIQTETILDGSNSQAGPDITYLWTGPVGGIQGPMDQLQITALVEGLYVLKVMNVSNGCFSEDEVYVAANTEAPNVEAGFPQEFACNDQTLVLSGATDADSYLWLNENEEVISLNLDVEINTPGWYTLQVTDGENGCTAFDSVFISVDEDVPHGMVLDFQSETCHGDQDAWVKVLEVNGGSAPYQYSFDGQNFSSNTEWHFLGSGTYHLLVRDAEGCAYEETLFLPETPEFLIDLGPDLVLELGQSQVINVQTNLLESEISDVVWTPLDEITCVDDECLNVLVSPTASTGFQVTLVDTSGCVAEDELQLKVKKNRGVFIPNVFTPNHDGINDRFYIQGLSSIKIVKRFIVLDRWGEVMFENINFNINDPTEGWNGNFKNEELNSGVFVYMAEIEFKDGFVATFKGDVTLMR